MTDIAATAPGPKPPTNSIFSHARYVVSENLVTGFAFGLFALIALCALIGPYVVPYDPLASNTDAKLQAPSLVHWFGTDALGRDIFSRVVVATRLDFVIALSSVALVFVMGGFAGIAAGYFGGWTDRFVSRIVDIWMAFPPVLFSILLVAVLGTGLHSVITAIVAIDWIRFCRVVRAETLAQTRMDYVDSARAVGFSRFAVLAQEVFPNLLPTIVALLSLEMGIAVIVEAILSFVNLSISTDDPTWGGMIAEGRSIIHFAWWVLVFPLIVLFLTVLAFGQFGEGLRDRFDPILQ